MAYYLVLKRRSGYEKLDISNLKDFKRLSRYKKDTYSLEEIDCFTGLFNNEMEFRRYLYQNNIINNDDFYCKLSLRYGHKGELEKVLYDFIYKGELKYLNTDYLRNKILILSENEKFIRKLVNHYRMSYSSSITINIIANYLQGYQCNKDKINSYLNKFFEEEIFSTNRNTGEVSIKYRDLHDLATFVIHYEKESELVGIRQLPICEQEVEVKKKVKRKEKEVVDGQLSFWDK